jgi:hypothetical protein
VPSISMTPSFFGISSAILPARLGRVLPTGG